MSRKRKKSAAVISLDTAKDKPNYYEILQIEPDARQAEIIRAYRRAKETYKQNSLTAYSLFSDEEIEKSLALIDEAYQVLEYPEKRRLYDQVHLPAQEEETTPPANEDTDDKDEAPPSSPPPASIQTDAEFERFVAETREFSGAALKSIREHRHISLEDIAAQTKICKSNLNAIEEEQSALFPPKVFMVSFLRQYAALIGLEPQKVVDSYPPLKDLE